MTTTKTRQPGAMLANRLRQVRVGTRQDLDVSRHMFRGEASYLVRDPMTFGTHSLTVGDYEVFIRIGDGQTLDETFCELVRDGVLRQPDEEGFYRFVLQMHQLGFMILPVSDAQSLYQRHKRRRAIGRRNLALSVLFLRIPLFNPDAFLDRTMNLARPIFSKAAFVVWLLMAALSLVLAIQQWESLTAPLAGVLVLQNLPLLWAVLVLLKIFHEFGHAYACKHFGGCVPEMGAYLILFTPCAYMNATDSWRFTRKRDRLIVCFAGMYIESIIAMLAMCAWSMTETSSFLNAIAYQTMLLASLTTIAFNANPLMRFDGYYILTDLLEIPNLRKRSSNYVLGCVKRCALGIRSRTNEAGRRLRFTLATYAISAGIYRVLLVFGIGALIAARIPVIGMSIAAVFVAGFVISIAVGVFKYLLGAEETAPIRGRAAVVGVAILIAAFAGLMFLPVSGDVVAAGVLDHERTRTLYAPAPGFLRAIHVEVGQTLAVGDPILELEDPHRVAAVVKKEAQVRAAVLRLQTAQTRSESHVSQERQRLIFHQRAFVSQQAELAKLQIHAEYDGTLIEGLRTTDIGRYVREGEAVATMASGHPVIRALVAEHDLAAADPLVGLSVECRGLADVGQVLRGEVVRVALIGSREVGLDSLTHLAGGEIAVDDATGKAERAYFEITVRLDEPITVDRSGATFLVRLPAPGRSLGDDIYRRLLRFRNRLRTDR